MSTQGQAAFRACNPGRLGGEYAQGPISEPTKQDAIMAAAKAYAEQAARASR